MLEKNEEIILSDGQKAWLIKTDTKFKNILIVDLDGVLRVVDKETKTLAQTFGETQNRHSYYVKKN